MLSFLIVATIREFHKPAHASRHDRFRLQQLAS